MTTYEQLTLFPTDDLQGTEEDRARARYHLDRLCADGHDWSDDSPWARCNNCFIYQRELLH